MTVQAPTSNSPEAILAFCRANMDASSQDAPEDTTDPRSANSWTIVDLFLRQFLNNMSDGFGMTNVAAVFDYLVTVKDQLIEHNLISKEGRNNSGFPLWEDYNFDERQLDTATRAMVENHTSAMRAMMQGMFGQM
jgi:hypothetical protein